MNSNILEIKHLKKYYGNNRGIEDVSISLKEGEIYGFIGPNGAGKSTTIRTIIGLINKTSGNIYYKGKELNRNDIEIKEEIGYLPSEIHLYEDMSVKEILDYHESFYQKNIHPRRIELVKKLKVDESKKIEDLSLGNLKKVGIILALMHKPKLLILDEATSCLDPMMQSIFHDILKEEQKNKTTILYSSHVLNEISTICNRIGFIKEGIIIKEDTIENIKKNNYTYLTIKSKNIKDIKEKLKLPIKKEENDKVTFINNLDINQLLKELIKYNIEELLIEEVTLEDLFTNYYK